MQYSTWKMPFSVSYNLQESTCYNNIQLYRKYTHLNLLKSLIYGVLLKSSPFLQSHLIFKSKTFFFHFFLYFLSLQYFHHNFDLQPYPTNPPSIGVGQGSGYPYTGGIDHLEKLRAQPLVSSKTLLLRKINELLQLSVFLVQMVKMADLRRWLADRFGCSHGRMNVIHGCSGNLARKLFNPTVIVWFLSCFSVYATIFLYTTRL